MDVSSLHMTNGVGVDYIARARIALEALDEAYEAALSQDVSTAVLDELAQAVADAEATYYTACDRYGR